MAEFTNEMVEVTEAEVTENVTTESTAIVPAADEYVPEAEPEKKGNKALAIGVGVGALGLGIAAVKWGPQLMATIKAKSAARKNAKNALAAQVKAQEIYNNLNSVDDETLKKYYNERFSTPAPAPTTNDNKPENTTQTPENKTENAAQTAQAQATTQPENKTEEPNNKANNKKK